MHEELYGTIYNTTTLCCCAMSDCMVCPSKRMKEENVLQIEVHEYQAHVNVH